jgi:hypothetical protein
MNILSEVKNHTPHPVPPPQTRKSIESEENFIHNMRILTQFKVFLKTHHIDILERDIYSKGN